MNLLLLILISPLPSLIWLYFLLRAEKEKEPKIKIFEIFCWGVNFAFFLILVLIFFSQKLILSDFLSPFVEEFVKFLPFYLFVRKSKFFNKPEDGIVYMVTSSLGFVAVENFLLSLSPSSSASSSVLFLFFLLRFLTGTYLHALSGATFGYFLSSFYFLEKKIWKVFLGFLLAGFFHFFYNLLIEMEKVEILIFYLLSLTILIYILFKKLWRVS